MFWKEYLGLFPRSLELSLCGAEFEHMAQCSQVSLMLRTIVINLWTTAVALGNDYLEIVFSPLRRKFLFLQALFLAQDIKNIKEDVKVIQGNIIKDLKVKSFIKITDLWYFIMSGWTMKTKFNKICLECSKSSGACSSGHKWWFPCMDSHPHSCLWCPMCS